MNCGGLQELPQNVHGVLRSMSDCVVGLLYGRDAFPITLPIQRDLLIEPPIVVAYDHNYACQFSFRLIEYIVYVKGL